MLFLSLISSIRESRIVFEVDWMGSHGETDEERGERKRQKWRNDEMIKKSITNQKFSVFVLFEFQPVTFRQNRLLYNIQKNTNTVAVATAAAVAANRMSENDNREMWKLWIEHTDRGTGYDTLTHRQRHRPIKRKYRHKIHVCLEMDEWEREATDMWLCRRWISVCQRTRILSSYRVRSWRSRRVV